MINSPQNMPPDQAKIFLEPEMMKLLTTSFSESERALLSESFRDISDNIVDVFEGMSSMQMIEARNITFQEVFNELAKTIPHYIPLLKESMQKFGDETFFEKHEVIEELGAEALNDKQFFPKLLIDDGSRAFALMQIAAHKAGIADDNLRLWYTMLYGLITAVSESAKPAQVA